MSRTRTYVAESRPYDSVLDSSFIQGSRDVAPAPAFSQAGAVSGARRNLHAYRPRVAHVDPVPAGVLFATTARGVDPTAEPTPEESEETHRDAGVQTAYRESDAQTDPYTPAVVLDPTKPPPEVLLLEGLKANNGLPAGFREVTMIELARRRRAFEAALPPPTDGTSVALRVRLMEQLESEEFAAREQEIDDFQEDRLKTLALALAERDRTNEYLADVRVDALRQRKLANRDQVRMM